MAAAANAAATQTIAALYEAKAVLGMRSTVSSLARVFPPDPPACCSAVTRTWHTAAFSPKPPTGFPSAIHNRPVSTAAGPHSTARVALVLAVFAVSFSAIFIRLADGDAFTIAWVRLGMAAVLLIPLVIREARARPPLRHDVAVGVLAGVLLTIHFLTWTAALSHTSIASAVLLVSLHPLLVVPVGRRLLGEPMPLMEMALALGGTVVTCVGDFRLSGAIGGDLLALAGAGSFAGYLLVGRLARARQGAAGYSAVAYATVATLTIILATLDSRLHSPSFRTVLACLALAAVCTVGGHTVLNWVLRHLATATVSVALLGEPPITALLAWAILLQVPSATTVAGGLLILPGIALALREPTPPAMLDAPG